MQLKKLMKDLVDAVDGAGREFKTGFSGAFRKRGIRHRADADTVRKLDRDGTRDAPKRRAEPPKSHAKKKYKVFKEALNGLKSPPGYVGRHAESDYSVMQDLGKSVGKSVRDTPGDILKDVKGLPKKVPGLVVDELYEDAIGQDDPDKYGRQDGDMRFLAPGSEAAELSGMSQSELETRLGLEAGALDGANVEVNATSNTRFVSVDIEMPGSD